MMTLNLPKPIHASPRQIALVLRIGLGSVFLIGGINKLSQLLDPVEKFAIVATYLGLLGYINEFFSQFVFQGPLGAVVTPWGFLTTLSTFEVGSGLALLIGLMVRPLALVFGLLLWTFVAALPVVTAPGVEAGVPMITAPAMLVQIRDIALSGMMFVLYNLGPGAYSFDEALFGQHASSSDTYWDTLGLLLRMSIAAPLIVGGVFAGFDHIQNFQTDWRILVPLGLALVIGLGVRWVGAAVLAVMLWFVSRKLDLDSSLIANLNGFKREIAFLGAGAVLALVGGGAKYTLSDIYMRLQLAGCCVTQSMTKAAHCFPLEVNRYCRWKGTALWPSASSPAPDSPLETSACLSPIGTWLCRGKVTPTSKR